MSLLPFLCASIDSTRLHTEVFIRFDFLYVAQPSGGQYLLALLQTNKNTLCSFPSLEYTYRFDELSFVESVLSTIFVTMYVLRSHIRLETYRSAFVHFSHLNRKTQYDPPTLPDMPRKSELAPAPNSPAPSGLSAKSMSYREMDSGMFKIKSNGNFWSRLDDVTSRAYQKHWI